MVHASSASAKTVLRLQMRDLRQRLALETPDAASRAAEHLSAAPQVMRLNGIEGGAGIVSGYRPLGGEFDPWPVLDVFAKAGARLALPVALARDAALVFRAYQPGDRLAPDALGVPSPTSDAAELEPDLVIAPLLAFDRTGARMGQGAGCYDRTLQPLRARRRIFVLGLAYAGQEVARIPTEDHDQRLDAILTENGYIEASKDC